MESPRRQPTLDEVAVLAGVSRSAASRAVNNGPHVSRSKRDAVMKAVRQLGYVPNATARALATNQAGAVVLAVANDDPALFTDPFYAQIIIGVATELDRADLDLTLMLAASAQGRDRLKRMLRSRRSDGFMVIAPAGDDWLAAVAHMTELPVVFCGRPLGAEPSWYVDADNRGGARLATEHLVALGRRRIAMIAGPMDLQATVDRHRGFTDAMAVAGLEAHRFATADFSPRGGTLAMERLLDKHPDIDGVFAASDNVAAGALRTLRSRERTVPGDVAVVGFDDLTIAAQTEPDLTTVHQPIDALGQEMAKMMVRLIAGERPSPLIVPTHLVVRGSAPAAP
ncbi:LacI family DNA-binding transcriptional regulator [Cellulomonas edaphi]|uniref:LacI family DNA-binding transcriptional regulator n=1 Tax=Cellulomonas edaphi TaxID=3053468 RepID=A0ABT7S6P7_9CELL|nr:LacI family DNA-binding transcriptional regulator [Cellulomons edaphi]MDM7831295.1 LacI family DNA-binding transcriptional regulator [Cellulomons edaphi]